MSVTLVDTFNNFIITVKLTDNKNDFFLQLWDQHCEKWALKAFTLGYWYFRIYQQCKLYGATGLAELTPGRTKWSVTTKQLEFSRQSPLKWCVPEAVCMCVYCFIGSYQYPDTSVWQCAVWSASTSSVSADRLCTSPPQTPPSQHSGNRWTHTESYNDVPRCESIVFGLVDLPFLPWLWWWDAAFLCCQPPWGWLDKTDPCSGRS